jgi:hypothetical protein
VSKVTHNQKIHKYLSLSGIEYFMGFSNLEVQIYKLLKGKRALGRPRHKLEVKRRLYWSGS